MDRYETLTSKSGVAYALYTLTYGSDSQRPGYPGQDTFIAYHWHPVCVEALLDSPFSPMFLDRTSAVQDAENWLSFPPHQALLTRYHAARHELEHGYSHGFNRSRAVQLSCTHDAAERYVDMFDVRAIGPLFRDEFVYVVGYVCPRCGRDEESFLFDGNHEQWLATKEEEECTR